LQDDRYVSALSLKHGLNSVIGWPGFGDDLDLCEVNTFNLWMLAEGDVDRALVENVADRVTKVHKTYLLLVRRHTSLLTASLLLARCLPVASEYECFSGPRGAVRGFGR